MSEVPLGKIQSLVCQVMVLSDRVDKLERLVEGLRKGIKSEKKFSDLLVFSGGSRAFI